MSCCRRLCFPAIAGQVIHTKLWIVKEKKKQKKKYSSNSNILSEIGNANLKDVVIFGCGSLSGSVLAASTFELLFVNCYIYIFIHQRFRAVRAMNPVAIGSSPLASTTYRQKGIWHFLFEASAVLVCEVYA